MILTIRAEYEAESSSWIAELTGVPNTLPILVYGESPAQAVARVKQAGLQALVWAMESDELSDLNEVVWSVPGHQVA